VLNKRSYKSKTPFIENTLISEVKPLIQLAKKRTIIAVNAETPNRCYKSQDFRFDAPVREFQSFIFEFL